MQKIQELQRRPSPAGRPQPLAFDGVSLWMGSWDTDKIYQIEPSTGNVLREVDAPGKPYGLAFMNGVLHTVVAIGDDDDRYFYTFDPATGFDESSKTACPDFTGSHLACDGTSLYLAQMHNRRFLVMTPDGGITGEIPMPTRIGGASFHNGKMYVITADDEFENLHFATFNIEKDAPDFTEIATMADGARSLAFDGQSWWTSYRDDNELVSFAPAP